MTNYSRSVLKSNGLHHSENLPVKFGFSPIDTPANIAKKLPPQVPSQTISHHDFQLLAQMAHVCFHRRKRVHTRLSEKDRTQRLTRRNRGPSRPRPQRGLVPPAKFLLFHHAFIYIHFPVLCEPPLSAERKIRRNCRHKFYPQPFLIPVFNFSHKRPTFAFTGESGHTLDSPRKIAHSGSHAETEASPPSTTVRLCAASETPYIPPRFYIHTFPGSL